MFPLLYSEYKIFSWEIAVLFSACTMSRRMDHDKCPQALELLWGEEKDQFAQSVFIRKQLCHHPLWELCLIRTVTFSPVWISAQHTELCIISSAPLHRPALAWRVHENRAHLLYSYIVDPEHTVPYCAKKVFAFFSPSHWSLFPTFHIFSLFSAVSVN